MCFRRTGSEKRHRSSLIQIWGSVFQCTHLSYQKQIKKIRKAKQLKMAARQKEIDINTSKHKKPKL